MKKESSLHLENNLVAKVIIKLIISAGKVDFVNISI